MNPDNPFYHRGPIHDARFFWNRTEEVEQTRLLLGLGQSVSLVGPRRIGKSSLLLQLLGANRTGGGPDRYVYFNCEGWSAASPASLHALLLEAIGADSFPTTAPSVPPDSPLDYRRFREGVLNAIPPGARLVLMLDEFESLSANPSLDAGFFSGLRALASTGRVVFVTASARSLGWLTFAEPTALSSPFFNIFTQIVLRPFAWDVAAEMLRHFSERTGSPFADATVDFVLSLSGPHPFFVQIAAFYAFALRNPASGLLEIADQKRVRREFLAQAESHWRYAWSELQPVDRKQLAISTDLRVAKPGLLRRLGELALLDNDGALLSPLLAAFLARQPVEGLLQAPPLVIDESQRRVVVDGQALDLTGLEYELLHLLAAQAGEVVSQAVIQSALWPGDDGKADNSERLKSVVKSLRRKLGEQSHLLQNARGVGYIFAAERIQPPNR
ncbi:MAG: winged helix-turn-helix domain-containing protein [Caldilineaceae bacterium]|nr:winged helix-turn-helix domain-containing protein [Caldilineaceae bacterium]